MLPVKFPLQVSLLVMVIISGLLLGLSQENLGLSAIAIIGSLAGFVVCDWSRKFQLSGLLANIVSILVLFPAMSGFIDGDGETKLICVSNLLIYLQIVLMFQEKNTRRNWQIMVLSLLQAVVAAIFHLEFEGGLLFLAYFGISGLTMILQSINDSNSRIVDQNRTSAARMDGTCTESNCGKRVRFSRWSSACREAFGWGNPLRAGSSEPVVFFDAPVHQDRTLPVLLRHLVFWLGASMAFALLLFFFIPRNSDAWLGPLMTSTTATGMTREVDLNQRGKIEFEGGQEFRVSVTNSLTGENTVLNGPVYFRGIALGDLKIIDGKTKWTAPYNRVFPSAYRKLRELSPDARRVIQTFRLAATSDPMLYSMMPAYSSGETPNEVDFCLEISSLSRRQDNDQIEKSQYRYDMMTLVDEWNQPLESWPYMSQGPGRGESLLDSPGEREWLTYLDPSRYPTLVRDAEQLATKYDDNQRVEILRNMEQHFSSSQFSYSLDFSNVDWNESLDPVEDFYKNHKCGHCELYASALVLMLRSQGIPARLVVGYRASSYNTASKYYLVRDSDAHAWVEAYLRPQDCTETMLRDGNAGLGGAWLRLDPTPASELASSNIVETPMERARSFWQEYVIGMDRSRSGTTDSSFSVLGWLDISALTSTFENAADGVNRRPVLRVVLILIVLLAVIFGVLKSMAGRFSGRPKKRKRRIGIIRQWFGSALGLISPGLGQWVIGADPMEISTVFYNRLIRILKDAGHTRRPAQTHREFADEISAGYQAHPGAGQIAGIVDDVTSLFYEVRFGGSDLTEEKRDTVLQSISELESLLKESPG